MLNAIHSKWHSQTQPIAKQGQNPQTTTTTTKSQTRVLPTTTRRTETSTTNQQRNQNQIQSTTKQFIQLKAQSLPRSGRTILVKRPSQQQHRENREQHQRPIFLKNYEILSQESLAQLLNQNQLLNSNLLLNQQSTKLLNRNQLLNQMQLLNQLNQRATNRSQAIPTERIIQLPIQKEDQEETSTTTETPIYTIISVPFLARSFLPTPSVKQRKLKTNGLVKTKQVVVNANAKDDQTIILCPEQENTSAHLNLLNQQQQNSNSNRLNTTTVKSLNANPINLNTTRTPITTTSSNRMMGIHLPGNEFQDMNGALQIAAVEELMAPVCLDDYFIETYNNSDFDTNKGTYKLDGLNEMTINQMNVDFAGQLQSEDGQEEQLMKEVPGEEQFYSTLRMQHSEELVGLTQPSLGRETQESQSLFTAELIDAVYNNEMITTSEDSENSSSFAISPGSPLPTESDCIATSKLHNYKYMDENCNSMQDDETSCRIEFSPEHSPMARSNSINNEEVRDIEQILKQLVNEPQQQTLNLKRNGDHLSNTQMKIAGVKKSRINRPRLMVDAGCEVGLAIKVPDTPEVCSMLYNWLSEDTSIPSYNSSPSWSGTSFAAPEFNNESYTPIEPKYENPPSIASSYIYEEPSYATPSPSDSSSCTHYSTNPNSPAVSAYGSGSSRKPRGRPPKQHSDLPDPEVWRKLPETERKRYEDRCKNNEASRQSRQKNKEKQMSLLADEEREQRRNDELKNRKKALDRQHRKLKRVLYRKWGNTSSD